MEGNDVTPASAKSLRRKAETGANVGTQTAHLPNTSWWHCRLYKTYKSAARCCTKCEQSAGGRKSLTVAYALLGAVFYTFSLV